MNKEDIISALTELRKNEKKKFNQSVDLIINLQKFDVKKESINLVLILPNPLKKKSVCAFLEKKSTFIDTVSKEQFDAYKDKKKLKKLAKAYDFFISTAKLMPAVATNFGRILGPLGKMPSPQLGIIIDDSENSIKNILSKIDNMVKVKAKEPSIKLVIGKEEMEDEKIAQNILMVYNAVLNALPRKMEQMKSAMIKFTMTKPVKIKIK
jgi:large subunit ribosomal protein L1